MRIQDRQGYNINKTTRTNNEKMTVPNLCMSIMDIV